MRDDSSSSTISLPSKLQVLGQGCHPHEEGRSLISYIGKLVGTLCCNSGVQCGMRSLTLPGTLGPGCHL